MDIPVARPPPPSLWHVAFVCCRGSRVGVQGISWSPRHRMQSLNSKQSMQSMQSKQSKRSSRDLTGPYRDLCLKWVGLFLRGLLPLPGSSALALWSVRGRAKSYSLLGAPLNKLL